MKTRTLTTLLMAMLFMTTAAVWADETITVTANSSDISEGLDLKVVAKLFAEAENLEQFEMKLNNPDSAFCNLDLNGDGQVDYLRVIETGEGNKRLIVLQAILAKDIYQDVASIYVEKDEAEQVTIQVIGDEYVYGANYIIEPVFIRRPLIYDWFWSPMWYAWTSPWYWDYYPSWWYVHNCWAHDWYWHHCYAFHHHHHWCSFRPGKHIHHGWHELRSGVTRRDYALAHPDRSFSRRNAGMANAREIRSTNNVRTRNVASTTGSVKQSPNTSRTFGSQNTVAARSTTTAQRSTATTQRTSAATAQRSTTTTQRTSAATAQRSTATTQRTSAATAQRSTATTQRTSAATTQRSTATTQRTSAATTQRSTPMRSTSYGSQQRSSSGSRSSIGSYSGGSSRTSGGSYSGGGTRSSGGGAHSGGNRR